MQSYLAPGAWAAAEVYARRLASAVVKVAHAGRVVSLWAWVWVKAWARRWQGGGQDSRPEAYRVYVFNEGTDAAPGSLHREISPRYLDPTSWERDIAELTGWDTFRVEIRYTFHHKKYRMVLRSGDPCRFPPYRDPTTHCRLPKGVLSARLQGAKGSEIDSDVTARVLKYQGPQGDFHAGLGLRVRLHDMFPFDDHSDNVLRFSHLRVLDTRARIVDLPYASNPVVTLPALP